MSICGVATFCGLSVLVLIFQCPFYFWVGSYESADKDQFIKFSELTDVVLLVHILTNVVIVILKDKDVKEDVEETHPHEVVILPTLVSQKRE